MWLPEGVDLLTCYDLQRSSDSGGTSVNHVCDAAGGSGSNSYQEAESTSHSNEHGASLPPGARDVPEPAMHKTINICHTKWSVMDGGTEHESYTRDLMSSQWGR